MKTLTSALVLCWAYLSPLAAAPLAAAPLAAAPLAAEPLAAEPLAAEPAPVEKAPPAKKAAAGAKDTTKEVTLKGTLGCGKCSFHEASACENVLKVKDGDKVDTYVLADNDVSKANHEKVCGPASPATVTGTVAEGKAKGGKPGKKVLTASSIKFE